MALQLKIPPPTQESQETGLDPWVGKIPWRRTWQPASVFPLGKSHGWRSLAGYSPWGDMTNVTEHACMLFVYWVLPAEFCSLKVHLLKS